MKVKLNYGFFIEIDKLCYTLKQNYVGKKGTGSRTHGHFSTLEDAVKKYLDLNRINKMKEEYADLQKFIADIRKADNDALDGIREELDRFPQKW